MNKPVIVSAEVESARFGLRVGRCELDVPEELSLLERELDHYDLVVLRYPAEAVTIASEASEISGFRSFTADHLCYWEWRRVETVEPTVPAGWCIDDRPDVEEVIDVVRDSFAGYRNHYSANPLLDRDAALDGYGEWAGRLAAVEGSAYVLRDPSGVGAGVALVDWSIELPDIRLAGMRSSAQGRGLYRVLLESVMERAVLRERDGLQISTQSHNVSVMRVWARAGFVPARTLVTMHLLRAGLTA